MADLFHSDDAENVTNLFYRVDSMVYVEGQDDIPFWEYMFESLTDLNIEVQEVGSCKALEPYIDKINKGKLKAIVACDSDLTFFDDDNINHCNIIRTFGYSIENTFICPNNLYRVIKTMARIPANRISIDDIKLWLSDFYIEFNELIKLDIFNHKNKNKNKKGKVPIGDNATRFMESPKSSVLCQEKVQIHLDKLLNDIPDYDQVLINNEIEEKGLELNYLIRGHFLFSAIARYASCFIKSLGIKISVSNDALYSALILSFTNVFNDKHPEYEYYFDALTSVDIAA